MKIAQVCPRYYPYIGGVETHVKEISERLVNRGYEIDVLTTDPEGKLPKVETINNVTIRRFKSWAPNESYYFSWALKNYLTKNSKNYDIVHAHSYHAFPAFYAAQAKRGNKLVFTPRYHGGGHTLFRNLLHIPYKLLGRKILEKADKIICLSEYERKLLLSNFRLEEKKVIVIPNGINTIEFKNLKKRKKNKYSRMILCVSRLEKYKGIDYLIRVLPKLDAGISLVIVGKGPYKKALMKLVHKLALENRVKFYSDLPRKELLQLYSHADIFVLLSKYEAFGNVVAEALASGTPCIVANASALKHWVDNKNCFGIDYPINLNRLAKLINEVIGKEVKGVKLQDWNDVVKQLENIYLQVLS